MCRLKTGGLSRLAARAALIAVGEEEQKAERLGTLAEDIGACFQIMDDVLDFTGDEQIMGKPVGNDLLQGILTLPAILLMEQYPDDNPVKTGFENRGKGKSLKQAIAKIRDSSLIKESYSIADDFSTKARQAVEILPDGGSKSALIGLVKYVIERKK